ncbi:spore germination protein GerW family protein [Cellulomonas sp. KH9]|uniref:spore germination protein GerW family protein n=1 Tax=Cellulomonas sp. KH9 TaxID=1855324 RepID=UPI0008E7B524|nr:spore germination protein GerW family protein [Cellulomonas sp. KH9]SFK37441.1 Sporulation protein YtfJ (Spore_YtfJ) [Cellulomonas sp. KH9]
MTERRFDPGTLTRAAEDTFTVRRVFGEAYERDGRLVVPVARVTGLTGSGAGGGGGDMAPADGADDGTRGTGHVAHGTGDGGGGGFATHVTPLGVFVVDDHGARWQPTLDLNRVILGGQVVAAVVASAWAVAWAVRRR